MSFKFFTITTRDDGTAESELNAFMRSHRVLHIDRRWVDQGADSFWSFCVEYIDSSAGGRQDPKARSRGKDYREVLSPDDFALFAKLRELRKEIGQAEGVPVYTIFTNEQLAQMVQDHVRTKADMASITGVGEARIEKYGTRFLELLADKREDNEANGQPV